MNLTMSASEVERHPLKMTRYAATNVKYTPESHKSMRTRKLFKLTPTQEDIYKLINTTEERPMSSTLSPYAPLPAIGGSFMSSPARTPQPRAQDRKHQVLMETVDLRQTRPARLGKNRGHPPNTLQKGNKHDSKEFIQNCIKDVEKKGTMSKSPSTSNISKVEKPFTLVREGTYDLLEPKILKAKREESAAQGLEVTHSVATEQFGPVTLDRSTAAVTFFHQFSSEEGDGSDLEQTGAIDQEDVDLAQTSALEQEDVDVDINDNTGDTLNNQLWQLRNASGLPDSPPEVLGTNPRVLALRRANEGLPSASRFADGDSVTWETRTRRMNRLNFALRVNSGRDVNISEITPLYLDSEVSLRHPTQEPLEVKTPRIEDIYTSSGKASQETSPDTDYPNSEARFRDVKTPLIGAVPSKKCSLNRETFGEKRNNSQDIDMIEHVLAKTRFKSAKKFNSIDGKTPSTEHSGDFNDDMSTFSETTGDSSNSKNSDKFLRNWNLKTPSIEELPTIEGDSTNS